MFETGYRWVGLFILVLTLSGVVITQSQQQLSPYQKLGEYYYYKCFNQTHNLETFNKLNNDASEFAAYFQYTAKFLPYEKKVFCDSERKNLNNRMVELSKDLEPCLPPKEKYMAGFIKESFQEFLHFLCHNNGENINKIFRTQAKACRDTLFSDGSDQMSSCFARIFKPLRGYATKSEICDDYNTAKKCFQVTIDEKCPTYTSYKNLVTDLFSYVSRPCSACINNNSSIVLLILTMLISYIFNN